MGKDKKNDIRNCRETHPKEEKGKTTPWLSNEAISRADERKDAKSVGDKDKVRSLNRAFQKQAREDKKKKMNDMCKVMEEEGQKGRTKEMLSKVKEITRKFTPRMGSLKSRDGKVIGDEEGMKTRWKEYSEELYSEDKRIEKEQTYTTDFEMEPEVMEAEGEWAIKQLKNNKAPGQDGIPI